MKNVLSLQEIRTTDTDNYAEMTGSAASLGCDGDDQFENNN